MFSQRLRAAGGAGPGATNKTQGEQMAGALAITGAGRGIGRAIALRMARDGWAVAVSDINGDSAAAVAAEIEQTGVRARGDALDVTDPDAVVGLGKRGGRRLGRAHRRGGERRHHHHPATAGGLARGVAPGNGGQFGRRVLLQSGRRTGDGAARQGQHRHHLLGLVPSPVALAGPLQHQQDRAARAHAQPGPGAERAPGARQRHQPRPRR